MSSIKEMMEEGNYKPAESSDDNKFFLKGVYKATFASVALMEDKGYGESIYGAFQINEVLSGNESKSQFPQFTEYYSISPENITNKKKGLAKLLDGLFSIGIDIALGSKEETVQALTETALGADVYINAFKKQKMRKEGEEWVKNEGEFKQSFNFLTEKAAMKKAKKNEEAVPF